MAVKWPFLDCQNREREGGSRPFLDVPMVLENCLHSVVSRADHQGLDLTDGQEQGAQVSIVVVRMVRDESNHVSTCIGKG